MKPVIKTLGIILMVFALSSCNHVTYTPRSKKMVQKAKPSIVLLNRIIEFREENNVWPFSKEEFISGGQKYKAAFAGFPYLTTIFKAIDNNTMTFTFSEHYKDVQKYRKTQRVDLNSYGGQVRFYKEGKIFMWKLKMY
jgi:hypothetical protein